jgi:hypothetical protein
MVLRELGDPRRILGKRHHLPAPFEEAEDREGRQQQCERVEDRLPARVPGFEAQPEPQPDHGVHPGDHQHRELKAAAQRIGHEIRVQHARVVTDIGAIESVGDARLENVVGEEKGNRESQHELGRFGDWHLERAAQPQRPERQAVMNGKGAVEKNAAEGRRPVLVDLHERAIHRLDRNEAQAVVDEVGRHVCQHDEPRGQPKPPDHAVHLRSCFKRTPRALLPSTRRLLAEGVSATL